MSRRWFVIPMLAVACGSPTGPVGLQIGFTASRGTIAHGDTVRFTLTVRNPSAASVSLHGSGSCTFRWNFDQTPQPQGCTDDLRTWTFAPFETRTFTFPWAGFLPDVEGRPVPVPAGTYEVRGVIDANEGKGLSEPVRITVTGG